MATRPQFADAALAVGYVALELARIPMHAAERLPGMGRMSAEGAAIRGRARSRLEGLLDDVLHTPEAVRAVDRVLSSALPETIVRSAIENHLVERLRAELAETVDVDALAVAALEHEMTQRFVVASPALDELLVQTTDRERRRPESQAARPSSDRDDA